MPQPVTAGLAPGIQLEGGYIVRVTALNPTTGNVVSGVVVSSVSMQVNAADPEAPNAPEPAVPPVFAYAPST